jgi:hypothetical protein
MPTITSIGKKKIQKMPPKASPDQLGLAELVGGIMNDIQKASIDSDLTKLYWRLMLNNQEMLSHYDPSTVRIITAKVSLPVALKGYEDVTLPDPGLTKEQLAGSIKTRESAKDRDRIASVLLDGLNREGRNKLGDEHLIKSISEGIEHLAEDDRNQIAIDGSVIKNLRDKFIANPPRQRQARYICRAADLEKLRPENIIRFELTIDVSPS